jgi:hypothetical protein
MEISGELSVTFKVRNAFDLQRIQEFVRELEGQAPVVAETKRRYPRGKKSQEETFQKIIRLLKLHFPKGFGIGEAADLIAAKVDRERTTVLRGVKWAREKGILLQQGQGYYWTDLIKEHVAKTIAAESPVVDIAGAAPPAASV